MSEHDADVSALLEKAHQGGEDAARLLMPLVVDELRALAAKYLSREPMPHTLQPTALVNEAFLKLVAQDRVSWRGRAHFFAMGAKIMRRILVDHARRKRRDKRGGGRHRVALTEDMKIATRNDIDVLAVHEALNKLAQLDPRQERVVELRFFGGLTMEEVAAELGVAKRTVEDDWKIARAWLMRELSSDDES